MKRMCSGRNHLFRVIFIFLLIFLFHYSLVIAQSTDLQAPETLSEEAISIISGSTELLGHFVSEIGAGESVPAGILVDCAGVLAIPAPTTFADTEGPRPNTGVIVTRVQDQWSLPVFTSINSTSLGTRLSIQTMDIILVFMERETISRLLEKGKLEFGVDFSVAEGPAGGITDLSSFDAEVLAYRRTRGAYAGILAFTGGNLALEPNMTMEYYTESNQGTVQGYYSDKGEELIKSLLNQDQHLGIRNIPAGAINLKKTMERLADDQ